MKLASRRRDAYACHHMLSAAWWNLGITPVVSGASVSPAAALGSMAPHSKTCCQEASGEFNLSRQGVYSALNFSVALVHDECLALCHDNILLCKPVPFQSKRRSEGMRAG